jgi:hypothetical protein
MIRAIRLAAIVAGLCAVGYGAYVVTAFLTYGHAHAPRQADALVDRFMPAYDVREEHHTFVNAPAAITMEAAQRVSFDDSALIRTIFKAREIVLRAQPERSSQSRSFVDFAQSIGWRILANRPGRETVFGAVTQPWKADVVFRGIEPNAFAAFHEPDYVKIVWTLRADPLSAAASTFSTETRVVATDAQAREKFRRYWATYSPGIILIRFGALSLVKTQAERLAHRRPAS